MIERASYNVDSQGPIAAKGGIEAVVRAMGAHQSSAGVVKSDTGQT